ncbi:hypothetical protein ED312_05740 [Sinomicrobium pectinilyticum]|uniref:Uncharacterized protein n=1 Tax=Sinomicrobium pectinilyticum TaxID=1084421 RepID=A0A3N0ERW7_SINP1|nr:DUF6520 family protein [Sinomicrobium pectinilyticum]RNL90678.1 hypothetical protein ED312_05740 [Sinomicrobium pectinilyticum]
MKKSKFLLSLSAFVFACAGAFASINHMAVPADLYAKVNGRCQISCAAIGEFACIVSGALYPSIRDCENEQNTVTIGFLPVE